MTRLDWSEVRLKFSTDVPKKRGERGLPEVVHSWAAARPFSKGGKVRIGGGWKGNSPKFLYDDGISL